MALNKQTFITRTLTAIVFAVVMLVGLLWNHWSFFILFSIIHFGCWWEYLKLTEKIHRTSFHIYTKLGLMLMGYGIMLFFNHYQNILSYSLQANFSWPFSLAGFILLFIGIILSKKVLIKSYAYTFLGIIYISLSLGFFAGFGGIESAFTPPRKLSNSYFFFFPIFLIGCMWVNDTMAYLVGSLIGKKMLSKISPKKTWEGTIGGVLLCSLLMGLLHLLLPDRYSFHQPILWWCLLALIAAITGTFGDLLESKLKRMAGVKDSGSIMPGHGGFLDRFDSLLLATPFVWLYVLLFMK